MFRLAYHYKGEFSIYAVKMVTVMAPTMQEAKDTLLNEHPKALFIDQLCICLTN